MKTLNVLSFIRQAPTALPTPPAPLPEIIPDFAGSDYNHAFDYTRLKGQLSRVFDAMKDGQFRTLSEIEAITNDPQASISAQLRHLRKARFGGHIINKRPRGSRESGLFEYQLLKGA